ncbi:MAG: rane fusion protein multidrug efflux system [Desulfonauticus sp.]|nr:MAG: RND family efflux transporter, MFP subunit [Desulfonauticus sp. 38_4375]MDK2922208.1 rane fusion protein multidrug efflux system [Desulfonauticus sp.]
MEEAQALVEVRRAELFKASSTFERMQKVFKQGGISELEFIRAKSDYEQAKANLSLALSSLKQAQINLSYTQIKAPIDGKTDLNRVDEGDLVGVLGAKTPLVSIIQDNPLYVIFYASETEWLKLKEKLDVAKGFQVDIGTSEDEGYPYRGRLEFFAPQVDESSATVKLRAIVDNSSFSLEPGLFVKVRVKLEQKEALVVPLKAVFNLQDANFVYVLDKDNLVAVRKVNLGPEQGEEVVVEKGLRPEDKVLVSGLAKVRPGMQVIPKQAE